MQFADDFTECEVSVRRVVMCCEAPFVGKRGEIFKWPILERMQLRKEGVFLPLFS